MNATFRPFEVDGDVDHALTHMSHCLLGTYGTVPEEILAAVSSLSPTKQLMLTRQKDTGEPRPIEVEYAITPRRMTNWAPHLDVAWLTFTWVPEEGATRVNIRPMFAAQDAMEMLWDWLRETLNERGLLLDEVEQKQSDGKLPKEWPKTTTKQVKWRSLYPKVRLLAAQGKNATEIASAITGLDRRDVPNIINWGEWDKSRRRR